MTSNFRLGERVKHRKFVGTIVEIDNISARVFVEEQGNTRWVELDELTSVDDLAALQAENARLRDALEAMSAWKDLAVVFSRGSYRIISTPELCEIPLAEWNKFRDDVIKLYERDKARKALEGGE